MRVAKVIATCFLPKKYINKSYLVGEPLGFFGHSQRGENEDDIIKLIKFNIEKEKQCYAGVDRDLIIVNSDVNSFKGNKFISELSTTEIPGGKIICITRKNIGRSFGAYSDAFLKFRKDYDFFLFTEDDMIIAKNNYLKIGLDLWKKKNNVGFIAYIGTTKIGAWHWKDLDLHKKNAFSCHGASGLVSTKILDEVVKKHGCLPYNKGFSREKDITYGEVAFPNSILQLGYKLVDLPKNEILAIPAYDLMRGVTYKKWPNIIEKIVFLFKSRMYKIFSINKLALLIYLKCLNFLKKKA